MPLVFQETTMNSTLGRYVTVLETSMLRWVRHQVAQVSGMRSVVYLILSATWTGCMLVSHIGVGFCRFLQMAKLFRMHQVSALPMVLDSTWRATCS